MKRLKPIMSENVLKATPEKTWAVYYDREKDGATMALTSLMSFGFLKKLLKREDVIWLEEVDGR